MCHLWSFTPKRMIPGALAVGGTEQPLEFKVEIVLPANGSAGGRGLAQLIAPAFQLNLSTLRRDAA